MATPTPGTIPALPQYQPGALPLTGAEAFEIVNSTVATTAASYFLLVTDAVGKAPGAVPSANPTSADLVMFYQKASGLYFSTPIGNFGVQAGNMPVGGTAGQILEKNSGTNFDASWGNLSSLVGVTTGLAIAGSTAITLGIAAGGVGSTQIANNAVGNAQLRQGAPLSVIGVAGAATSNVADIAGTAGQVLRVNDGGTGLAFGQLDLASASAVTGLLLLSRGGLGADISATGGASQVLRQSSPGAAVTVSQLAFSDLSGQMATSQLPSIPAYSVITNHTSVAGIPTGTTSLWLGGAPGESSADIIFAGGTIASDATGAIKVGATYSGALTYIAGAFIEPTFGTSLVGGTYFGISINNAFAFAGYSLNNQIGARIQWPTKGSTTNIPLWINGNALAITSAVISPTPPFAGSPAIFVTPADGVSPTIVMDAYGTFAAPIVQFRAARGTAGGLAALHAGDDLFQFNGSGYDGIAWSAPAVEILGFAGANNWTTSSHSAGVRVFVTPENSTTSIESARFTPNAGFAIGTTVDPGAGNIILTGNMHIECASAPPAGGTTGGGYLISSTPNFGIFCGTGTPTLAAATSSLYLRMDASTATSRVYVNTSGSTTWAGMTATA